MKNFQKVGFGKNLISDDKVYKKISNQINETINDKKVLDKMNFKKGSQQFFLKENSSQKMMLLVSLDQLIIYPNKF